MIIFVENDTEDILFVIIFYYMCLWVLYTR